MEISESIVHGIRKEKESVGPTSITVQPRTCVLPLDAKLMKLGADVLDLYKKLSVAYGTLGSDPLDRFPALLGDYAQRQTTIENFSLQATRLIAEAMSRQRWSTTSFPVFLSYTNQGRQWLLIALLKLRENIGLNEDTLDLNSSRAFDVSHLREAARIDIEKWRTNSQPYLSFIKRGSGGDSESSQFFRDALSCQDYTDAKHNTQAVIRAIDSYCQSLSWSADKRQAARSKLHDHCREKKNADEPVNLTTVSAIINDQEPESFIKYVRDQQIEVSETFSPHPESYKTLRRISKKFRGVSVGFDVDSLFSEQVYYDEDNDALVLKNPPEDLINDMNLALGKGTDDEQVTDSD